jgi:hypothetical protein
VDPRVGLKVLRRAKSLAPTGIRSPDRSARSLFIILTTLGLLIEALWYFLRPDDYWYGVSHWISL